MRVSRVSMDRFFYIYKFLHLILEPLEIPPAPFLPPSLFFFKSKYLQRHGNEARLEPR